MSHDDAQSRGNGGNRGNGGRSNVFLNRKQLLPALPILEKDVSYNEWLPRVKAQMKCLGWAPMIDDENALPDEWPWCQQWMSQWVPFKDFHLIDEADNWIEANESLKRAYCPQDTVSELKLHESMFGITLTDKSTPQSVITQVKEYVAQLKAIGCKVIDSQIVAAVLKALNQSEKYAAVIRQLLYVDSALTLQRLQTAFSNDGPAIVPGAHMASSKVVPPPANPPQPNTAFNATASELDSIKEAFANLSEKLGKIKGQIKKQQYGPQTHGRGGGRQGGTHFQHPGGGRGRGQAPPGGYGGYGGGQGRGGYQARGGGRGPYPGRLPGNKLCLNCRKGPHFARDCRSPCGICQSPQHKATNCPRNPMCSAFIPQNQRGGGYSRPNANYVEGSSLDGGEAYANMSHAAGTWQPFLVQPDPNLPPGIGMIDHPVDPSMAPPSDVFMTLGTASTAALVRRGTKEDWFLDSGATNHFACERDMLHDFVPDHPMRPVYVRTADKTLVKRVGVGNIRVKTCICGIWYARELRGVWLVPQFHQNLLSLNKLVDAGCWMITGRNGDKNYYVIGPDDKLWLITKRKGGLSSPDWQVVRTTPTHVPTKTYHNSTASLARDSSLTSSGIVNPLFHKPSTYRTQAMLNSTCCAPIMPSTHGPIPSQPTIPSQAPTPEVNPIPQASYATPNVATDKETPELWHQRLGHTDIRGLISLVKHRAIHGIKLPAHTLAKLRGKHCQVCIMSKHNRSPFHPRQERADAPMAVLHSDICGPYPIRSIGGGIYVLTLVDEYSGFCAVSILKNLKNAHEELKRMILEWETKTGRLCKKLFSDRGGSYIKDDLAKWCAAKHIDHEFSTPRTPEQNGKAERLNQTLNNIMRALLFQYNCYVPLWSHAMIYAALIHNVSYSQRLDMSRHQAFLGDVPDVSNFRTFGCKVYARVADDARKKLDPKSELGIFLGPEPKGPGYKVLVYDKKLQGMRYQVHIVRDIVCFENLTAVTGVQDNSQLHWGGDIPLPTPQPVLEGAQPPESLTGEPAHSPAVRVAPVLTVGETRVISHEAAEGRIQLQHMQQGEQRVTRSRAATNAVEPPAANTPGVNGQLAALQLPPAPQPRGTGRAIVPRPDASQGRVHEHSMQQAIVKTTTSSSPQASIGNPPLASTHVIPPGRPILRVNPNATKITRIVHSRPPIPLPNAPNKTIPSASKTVGVPLSGTKRKIAFMASSTAPFIPIESEDIYDYVPQMYGTAFTASPPFPPPPEAHVASREELIDGLLRHFNVPTERTGPLPVISKVDKYAIPKTLKQAMASDYAQYWAEATVEEWLSLVGNNTWSLVKQEPWMKIIPCKWVFTIKTDAKGVPERFKARLVAGGHRQTEGIDYDETYAPVSRLATMRTMLSVAAHKRWKVHQLDVKNAFLHGDVDAPVYMRQPPGFVDGVQHVAKLNRSLYGLKQAPRIWYETLSRALEELSFSPVSADTSFWVAKYQGHFVYLTSVVDDILITSTSERVTLTIIEDLKTRFPCKHMGIASHYNGMLISWLPQERSVILSQSAHVQKLIDQFTHLADLKKLRTLPVLPELKLHKLGTSVDKETSPLLDTSKYPYRSLLGGLNYIACCTRPDISYIVNQLSRYANAPTVSHWEVAINVLRYLNNTINWGICLGSGSHIGNVWFKFLPDVCAFSDANHGTGIDDKKSISGHVLHVFGGPVSWGSHVQPTTSVSATESEYRAMSEACRESLWLAKITTLFGIQSTPFLVRGDSETAIKSLKNYSQTKYTKHIEIHHEFMKDRYKAGELNFEHIKGTMNPADIFTKALGKHKFVEFREALGMRPVVD
jgi:transposase InsO family protein